MTKDLKIALLTYLIFIAVSLPTAEAQEKQAIRLVSGYMFEIKDGDSFIMTDDDDIQEIRLFGVDTPEYKGSACTKDGKTWDCAQLAKNALINLTEGMELKCQGMEYDKYSRLIASCYIGKIDIVEWLVVNGYGQICERFSTKYLAFENKAKANKKGIWQGQYKRSYQCRKSNK